MPQPWSFKRRSRSISSLDLGLLDALLLFGVITPLLIDKLPAPADVFLKFCYLCYCLVDDESWMVGP